MLRVSTPPACSACYAARPAHHSFGLGTNRGLVEVAGHILWRVSFVWFKSSLTGIYIRLVQYTQDMADGRLNTRELPDGPDRRTILKSLAVGTLGTLATSTATAGETNSIQNSTEGIGPVLIEKKRICRIQFPVLPVFSAKCPREATACRTGELRWLR